MNALLVKTIDYPQTESDCDLHNPRLAIDQDVSGFSTTPTAHVRDLVSAGIKPAGLAVYFAIADRQMTSKGQYFRSNKSLADETGLKTSTVRKWIALLKKNGYLETWKINGGRRMRALTKVRYPDSKQVLPSEQSSATQIAPYKENNKKKTLQPMCVFSSSLLGDREDRVLWEGSIERLTATYGEEAVIRGLSVYDSRDPKTIDNPIGFLTKAIKLKWLPSKKTYKKTYKVDFYKRGDH